MLFYASVCALALLLDHFLGEPKRWHPLIGFAKYAQFWEQRLYVQPFTNEQSSANSSNHKQQFIRGLICWSLSVLVPVILVAMGLHYLKQLFIDPTDQSFSFERELFWFGLEFILSALVLYLAIGQNSLAQHAMAVYEPLDQNDMIQARSGLSMIVSRDTQQLDEEQITTATVETVIENTHDAVIGPIFWFLVFGIPGIILFRFSNTLDAMWGYKNAKYEYFGKTAARMDDFLGYFSARLTVLLFALKSPKAFLRAIRAVWLFGRKWYSPNAGPVMAAGAGALNLKLGGNAQYGGTLKPRALLNDGEPVTAQDIKRAVKLMYFSSAALVVLLFVIAVISIASAGY